MQDRYASDMGDFGKLGLLKYLILKCHTNQEVL